MTQLVVNDYFSVEEQNASFATILIEGTVPYTVRVVQYPNGKQELQGGYSWSRGHMAGTTWKTLPVVLVDENGMEFEKDVL